MSQRRKSESNKLLGYPADARLLIINADDFGMYDAINEAIFQTLKEGVVQSTTLMMPCPSAVHAAQMLRENPETAFGVHLSVICDIATYKWGSLSNREKIPSLLAEDGFFYTIERIPEFVARAKVDEVEIEFRSQIDAVFAANLNPTHLDWHCLHNGGRADIFEMTFRLAQEYGLAIRVAGQPFSSNLQRMGLPTNDHELLDSFEVNTTDKPKRYTQMLRELSEGLTEWAVHPGFSNTQAKFIDPDGCSVRQADYESMMSAQVREMIEQEGIILLNYKPIQRVWHSQ